MRAVEEEARAAAIALGCEPADAVTPAEQGPLGRAGPPRRRRRRHRGRGDRRVAGRPRRAPVQARRRRLSRSRTSSTRGGIAISCQPRASSTQQPSGSRSTTQQRPRIRAVPSGASLSGHSPYSSPRRSIARRTSACETPRASSSRDDRRLAHVLDAVDARIAVGGRRADVAPAGPLADRGARRRRPARRPRRRGTARGHEWRPSERVCPIPAPRSSRASARPRRT